MGFDVKNLITISNYFPVCGTVSLRLLSGSTIKRIFNYL